VRFSGEHASACACPELKPPLYAESKSSLTASIESATPRSCSLPLPHPQEDNVGREDHVIESTNIGHLKSIFAGGD
jgi:hypothetical protein